MLKKAAYIVAILLLTFLLSGCSPKVMPQKNNLANEPARETITVIITQDFGKQTVLEQEVEIDTDTSAMAALQMVANVETKYGGGFVSSINGISSEFGGASPSKKDWFFYINGIASNLGAADYVLRDGDVEHWDFRYWSYYQLIPAIIGAFPQPFLSGFQERSKPALVVYEEPFSGEAEALARKMQELGVVEVSAVRTDLLSDEARSNSNLIIIALPENALISEVNEAHEKLGFYAYFERGNLVLLNAEGNNQSEYSDGYGLIQATQNPWNPRGVGSGENVAWMVTGVDVNGVRSAVETLIKNHNALTGAFAVLISDKRVVKIP